jgi:hypothetical protein
VNFNGDSEMSDALIKYSCVLPSQPEVPYRVSGTRTELTLRWVVPSDDGGCPLTGFNLYRDDGNSGSITTEVDSADIRERPSLVEHKNLFVSGDTGKQFRYQLQVNNVEGSMISRVAAFVIADFPDKPTLVPWKVQENSDNTSLDIMIEPFEDSQNGGTEITGY